MDGAGLVLRCAAGVVFLFSGLQKLLPAAGTTAGYFRELGLPAPEVLAAAVGWLELLGGIALLVGVLTRVLAALLAVEMVGALWVARLPEIMAARSVADGVGAVRVEVLLIAVCCALVLSGAGRWSLDAAVHRRRVRHMGQTA